MINNTIYSYLNTITVNKERRKCLTATEEKREELVDLWLNSWKKKDNLGIEKVFAPDVHYIRSWGPEYYGLLEVEYLFNEQNDRGTIISWEVDRFIHNDDETIIHWLLEDENKTGKGKKIEGLSILKWNKNNQIFFVQDFLCNIHRSDPYSSSESPVYTEQQLNWLDKFRK